MYDNQKRRRQPEHDKFTSPEFERQQRQRTDDPAEGLPSRLRARLSWDPPADAAEHDQHAPEGDQRRSDDGQQRRSTSQDPSASQQQQQDGQQNTSGGRARIQFNLDKVQPPPDGHIKPRVSSKYSGKEPAAADPPVLKRLSGLPSDQPSSRHAAPAVADRTGREQPRAEGSSRRQLSPERGPTGRDRDRDRDRQRATDRDKERTRDVGRDSAQRRAPTADRACDSSRDRLRSDSRAEAAAHGKDRSGEGSRERSRPAARDRSREGSRERSRPAARDRSREGSRERSRPAVRERSSERAVQGSRERGRVYPPSRAAAARDEARLPRDSSRAREGDREQRPATRETRDDGFARPQPRAPPAQQQQQLPHPRMPTVQWDEIKKADAMLAAVRARHAGLVEQQLRHLILTQPLATENVWEKACQAADIPSELMDGPLVAMARRSDCDQALMSRASAHIMPPLDASAPSTLGAVGEDVYIQQLQAVINRYEQQSAAPYCAEVWALKGAGPAARRRTGKQQDVDERMSYSLLLPAELRGLLWDT